jgi:hypothetical protein
MSYAPKTLNLLLSVVLAVGLFPGVALSSSHSIKDVVFTQVERALIERYLGEQALRDASSSSTTEPVKSKGGKNKGKGKGKNKAKSKHALPKGLAKRDSLPPGLAKRKELPPGLRTEPLPADLERQLPPAPDGTRRVLMDGAAVLIEDATNTVLDILEAAVRQQ